MPSRFDIAVIFATKQQAASCAAVCMMRRTIKLDPAGLRAS
jgi:hypothetical protein